MFTFLLEITSLFSEAMTISEMKGPLSVEPEFILANLALHFKCSFCSFFLVLSIYILKQSWLHILLDTHLMLYLSLAQVG